MKEVDRNEGVEPPAKVAMLEEGIPNLFTKFFSLQSLILL